MSQVKKMCFDKILPKDLRRIPRMVEPDNGKGLIQVKAVAVVNKVQLQHYYPSEHDKYKIFVVKL